MNSVANVRVKDYILKSIREQILSGRFQPGMRLAQEELAGELGVSRIPVREALQILEEQGLVECLPSRHMVVAKITRRQLSQIFQTIAALQCRYRSFIGEGEAGEIFMKELSSWDKTDEPAFHRLFCSRLDNGLLSRQLHTMLSTYVEYACGLQGTHRKQTAPLLVRVQKALIKGEDREAFKLLGQYYKLLEENVWEERAKHSCRA